MRVLVIAPEAPGLEPLHWIKELGSLNETSGIEMKMLGGAEVRPTRLAQVLREGWDAVIWSGHGMENGLAMSDGSIVRGRWLALQVKAAKPRALVLAACGSRCTDHHGDGLAAIASKAGINVIGFPDHVPDEAAILYNVNFLQSLAAGSEIGDAHDAAIEAVSLEYPNTASEISLMGGITNGYRAIVDRLDIQDTRLANIERNMAGMEEMMRQMMKQRGAAI